MITYKIITRKDVRPNQPEYKDDVVATCNISRAVEAVASGLKSGERIVAVVRLDGDGKPWRPE